MRRLTLSILLSRERVLFRTLISEQASARGQTQGWVALGFPATDKKDQVWLPRDKGDCGGESGSK